MAKDYSFDVDGTSYILNDEEQYRTLLQALEILKTVVFLDGKIELIMRGMVFDRDFVDTVDYSAPVSFDNLVFECSRNEGMKNTEDNVLSGFLRYRESLEYMYKSLANYLPDNLKDLISSEGIPVQLFGDNRMNLEYHVPCRENEMKVHRYVTSSKEDFYVEYYQRLEKLVELVYSIDPFRLYR